MSEALFAGPGEMAERCRDFDWAATPLGPVDSWSQSLRTMAAAVLASRNPMLLFWGPDLIQFYNDAFRPSLGPADGPAPRHPRALGMPAAEFWTDVWEVIGPQIEGVMERGASVWFEDLHLPIERGDGVLDDAWWTYSYSPVRDDEGRINGTLVVCLETTSAVQARADLEHARAAAEAANRAKAEFLAVMSHELRTPLNAIDGYAELLQMGVHGPLTDAQRKAIERIRHSERHLLVLINDVLNFSRIEAGAVTYDTAEVAVEDMIAACDALTAPQRRAKSLSFRLGPVLPGLRVRADPDRVRQIVLNLMGNAVKFTEPGGSISVDVTVDGEAVAIAVRDTGRGIAPDEIDRIFEPFVQVDARYARAHEGVGLGLAISRDMARAMGGDLTVVSTRGAGSVFTLWLPKAG